MKPNMFIVIFSVIVTFDSINYSTGLPGLVMQLLVFYVSNIQWINIL